MKGPAPDQNPGQRFGFPNPKVLAPRTRFSPGPHSGESALPHNASQQLQQFRNTATSSNEFQKISISNHPTKAKRHKRASQTLHRKTWPFKRVPFGSRLDLANTALQCVPPSQTLSSPMMTNGTPDGLSFRQVDADLGRGLAMGVTSVHYEIERLSALGSSFSIVEPSLLVANPSRRSGGFSSVSNWRLE